jgi:hypothetical protein
MSTNITCVRPFPILQRAARPLCLVAYNQLIHSRCSLRYNVATWPLSLIVVGQASVASRKRSYRGSQMTTIIPPTSPALTGLLCNPQWYKVEAHNTDIFSKLLIVWTQCFYKTLFLPISHRFFFPSIIVAAQWASCRQQWPVLSYMLGCLGESLVQCTFNVARRSLTSYPL